MNMQFEPDSDLKHECSELVHDEIYMESVEVEFSSCINGCVFDRLNCLEMSESLQGLVLLLCSHPYVKVCWRQELLLCVMTCRVGERGYLTI